MFGIAAIIILVLATGFFVAAEFSIVSVRKTRIEQLISEGNSAAGIVKYAIEHLERYLAAIQIGVTMASLGLGALGEPVLGELLREPLESVLPKEEAFITAHGVAIALSFLIVTLLEIVFGEIVPKIIARQRSDSTALALIRPLNVFVFIFRPLIVVVSLFSGAVLRLFGLRSEGEYPNVYSVEELEMLVVSSRKAGVLDREEEVILRRVFDFGDLTARQVMLPRTEMMAIPVEVTLPEAVQIMIEHRFSRFPIYEGDLDNIVGVVHVRDVFVQLAKTGNIIAPAHEGANGSGEKLPLLIGDLPVLHAAFSIRDLMRPIEAVPETINVDQLLGFMQQKGVQIVVVVDEYGGTAGIVTLEDIVEEIVGEVRGEFEENEHRADFVVTPEGTIIDGLVAVDDVNETLGMHIETEADTIGGYVFDMLGRKPELGDEIEGGNGTFFHVEELDGLRIAKVRIGSRKGSPPPVPVEADEDA